jgi:hypothetical protein
MRSSHHLHMVRAEGRVDPAEVAGRAATRADLPSLDATPRRPPVAILVDGDQQVPARGIEARTFGQDAIELDVLTLAQAAGVRIEVEQTDAGAASEPG